MLAEQHLSKLGLTLEDARKFISSHQETDPEAIFLAAFDNAVTTEMLSEITNFSPAEIKNYFSFHELNSDYLNKTHLFFNTNLAPSLEAFVNYNEIPEGILSTKALREKVQPMTQHIDYSDYYDEIFFERRYPFQSWDDVYDPSESGIMHLGNIPASDDNLESIFYGTLINIFSRIDDNELTQIRNFSGEKSAAEYQTLLVNSLTSIPDNPINDDILANHVVDDAIRIITDRQIDSLSGLLDNSFLGLITV